MEAPFSLVQTGITVQQEHCPFLLRSTNSCIELPYNSNGLRVILRLPPPICPLLFLFMFGWLIWSETGSLEAQAGLELPGFLRIWLLDVSVSGIMCLVPLTRGESESERNFAFNQLTVVEDPKGSKQK